MGAFCGCVSVQGGHDVTITDNVIADTIAEGGGIHVGNRFDSVPISGTTVIARNTLKRCGCKDHNCQFGVGALWFYALDSSMPVILYSMLGGMHATMIFLLG